MKRTTEKIIQQVEETLYTAQLGLKLIYGNDPKSRMAGLRNLVVFGRAVTNVLQNLRSTEGDSFDSWYQPKVEEMENDQILKYFYRLRSEILKRGKMNTYSSMSITGNPFALLKQYKAPPGAKGFFMGDNIGGCGWEVAINENTTEKFYVNVPENIPGLNLKINVHLLEAPEEIQQKNIVELGQYYFNYLNSLVKEARKIFLE